MAPRAGRGWPALVALTLATLALAVVDPLLLVTAPLIVMLLALPPRRPGLLLLAALLALLQFTGAHGAGPLWFAERGWALMLGAWFVVLVVARPRAPFFSRALGAVAATAATAALLFLARHGGWARLDWTMGQRLRGGASDVIALWTSSGGQSVADPFASAVYAATDFQVLVFPALVGLASLGAMALAWWAFRRVAASETRPLGPLREFRFRDELVWVLIVGIVLVVVPWSGHHAALRAGSNLLTFMGALYALRGVAVLLALAGVPGPAGVLFAALATLFLYPLVMTATVLVGLTDTWLDLRARRKAPSGPES